MIIHMPTVIEETRSQLADVDFDVDVRCLAEWVAVYTHFEDCVNCTQHGACEDAQPLMDALDAVMNTAVVHAIAA